MTDAAVVFAGVSAIGARFSREHFLFDSFGLFLLPSLWIAIVAPFLLVVLIAATSASVRHALVIPVALLTLLVGAPIIQDDPAETPDGATRLSIYQHNMYVENTVFGRTVETVEREDPDIIALVEARDEPMAAWETRMAERWPHTTLEPPWPHLEARLRLFSKYEIIDYNIRKLDHEPATLRARIATPGGEVTVLLVHFTRPWPFRSPDAQMRHYASLEPMLDDISGPVVLLGDFNAAPWGRIGRRVSEDKGFRLVNRRPVGTWPGRVNIDDVMSTLGIPRFMTIPIDLAFCRGGLVCNNHVVGENLGSDHRYTMFDVWIPEGLQDDPATR